MIPQQCTYTYWLERQLEELEHLANGEGRWHYLMRKCGVIKRTRIGR